MNIEIEKKYIIRLPRIDRMRSMDGYTESEIAQIYLDSDKGVTHRVRSRRMAGKTVYTETKKVRIDSMSAYEDEREIAEEEFLGMAAEPALGTRPISKIRHTFLYSGQLFEIDIYPEWGSTAILETELESRDTEVNFPDFIEIVKDVTGDRRYSNAAMARSFPPEE